MEIAPNIDDAWKQFDIFISLIKNLPENLESLRDKLTKNALQAARLVGSEWGRSNSLILLAPYLPKELLSEALSELYFLDDNYEKYLLLRGLASYLPEKLLLVALEEARRLGQAYISRALTHLAIHLPVDQQGAVLHESLEEAKLITSDSERFYALRDLIPHVYEVRETVLFDALMTARQIEDGKIKASALHSFANLLDQDQASEIYREVLVVTQQISNEGTRARILSQLVSDLPDEMLKNCWEQVCSIPNYIESERAVGHIVSRMDVMCGGSIYNEFEIASEMLKLFSKAKREYLHGVIASLASTISHIGKERAVLETVQAIIDTTRWWP